MATEIKEIETDNKAISVDFSCDIKERFDEAYSALEDAIEQFSELETTFNELIPEKFEACKIMDYVNAVTEVSKTAINIPIDTATKITNALTSINANVNLNTNGNTISSGISIPEKALNYPQIKIILKYFELLKKYVKRFEILIEKCTLETTNKILKNAANGAGNATDPVLSATTSTLTSISSTLMVVINIIDILMVIIQSIIVMTVDAAGCSFFMTPKSMSGTKMNILNANSSLTNRIPQALDVAISEAEQAINKTNIVTKTTAIMESASKGMESATSENGFTLPQFPNLEAFDIKKIKPLIETLMLPLQFTADPLPRYEKLNILNIGFLIFLITGFEPAAKQSFGIPGMP